MHPNPAFRNGDRSLFDTLIDDVGFGMVFAQTPDGLRVAHTPLVSTGDGVVQFHLARSNALSRHLPGNKALVLINGPDAYVSARWYDNPNQVPTWNYVALELEGPVRRMEQKSLLALLEVLTERHEARIAGGEPWTIAKLSDEKLHGLLKGIVGFELDVQAWRETTKLSQNKPAEDRERIASELEQAGSPDIAQLMRTLAP